jgi:Asp-tRNA(Asn)/Glu-tRNA(Gln) amidotransferase A subunit family amidase
MEECVDGEYQNFKAKGGAYTREHFFGKYPELKEMVANMSDEDIWRLNRGGHDYQKVYNAYLAATRNNGKPTVILAKTVKGFMMGHSIESVNPTHQQKKLDDEALKEFRVAVMFTDEQSEVDLSVQDLLGKLTQFLGKRVKTLSTTARPAFTTKEAMDVYIALLRSATSRRQSDAEFAANSAKVAAADPKDNSYLTKMLRAYVLPHRDWLKYNERRHQMRLLWDQFFDDWDVMICPAAASAAFPHDHVGERHERKIIVNGKPVPTTDQLFWAGYSGCFLLPSTVAPMGLTPEGLPAGVQIITRQHGDYTAIRFAELLEKEYGGFIPPPGY